MEESEERRSMEGQPALVEGDALEATGIARIAGDGTITVDCDQECWPSGEAHEVSISIFAGDALYRVNGKATSSGAQVVCAPDVAVERIQRRRWPRRRMDLPVTLCPVEDGARLSGVPGRTIDVGVGGVCVETIRALEGEGDPMIILDLPDGTTIVAGTTTVAVEDLGDGWRYRLAFQDLANQDAGRLASLTTD